MKNKFPNSSYCFACGMENPHGLQLTFYENENGQVVGNYTVPKQFEGYPGIAHGGIVASILDEVVSRVFMVGDHNRFMYTAKLTIRYREPVPVEKPLKLVGYALKDRGRAGEAMAELYGPKGNLLAEAEALLVRLPPEVMDSSDLDGLGWRVYPDEEEAA
jgi:acyl-coenzyme A thioesterase PaaI-like protein